MEANMFIKKNFVEKNLRPEPWAGPEKTRGFKSCSVSAGWAGLAEALSIRDFSWPIDRAGILTVALFQRLIVRIQ